MNFEAALTVKMLGMMKEAKNGQETKWRRVVL